MSSNQHKVASLTIHLNAGASQRVVDFVTSQKNTNIVINRDAFGDYTNIVLTNLTQNDIDTFINKLKNVYPVEFDYNYTPKPKPKPVPAPKPNPKASIDNNKNKTITNKPKDNSSKSVDVVTEEDDVSEGEEDIEIGISGSKKLDNKKSK